MAAVVATVSARHAPLLVSTFCASFAPFAAQPKAAFSDVTTHLQLALNHWLAGMPETVIFTTVQAARLLRGAILPFMPWRPSRQLLAARSAAVASFGTLLLRGHLLRTCQAAASPSSQDPSARALGDLADAALTAISVQGVLEKSSSFSLTIPHNLPPPPVAGVDTPSQIADAEADRLATIGTMLPLQRVFAELVGVLDAEDPPLRLLGARAVIRCCELPMAHPAAAC